MYSGQSPSPQLGKSTYSSGANRKDVLWNVVEPGDPYDIRKSMIARLPGLKSGHFMGDNLEIVCLLQSAEIERLCEFLDDYKFRYREVERRELDRHSYEVQIKQLTQQLADEGAIRAENSKLKDFIKKQATEIEDLKNNRFSVDNNLRASYEESLAKFEAILTQNRRIKDEREVHLSQIASLNIRIQALQSSREHQKKQHTSYSDEHTIVNQAQAKALRARFESQISRLELELKRSRELNDAKNQQINQMSNRYRSLLREVEETGRTKADSRYEERFALMGQQIERLNLIILQSTAKLDESARNELYHRDRYTRLEEDYRQVEIRYREASEQLSLLKVEYSKVQSSTLSTVNASRLDEQVRFLNQQIHRLEADLILESQKYTSLQKQYSELEYNYTKVSLIERENAEMRAATNNVHELKRKVAEYETKIAILSQEIQRLKVTSIQDTQGRNSYDSLKSDYEELKRKSLEKERTITSRYESEMQKKVIEYEARLAKYAEESGSQFQFRLQAINREVEKLNHYLKQKTEQSEAHKRRIRELENSINQKYEIEAARQLSTYELTIKELKSQNEEVNRRLRQFETTNRRVSEYENTIAIMKQEIERLTFSYKTSVQQTQNLRRTNRQLEQRPSSNLPDFEMTRKISVYEQTQLRLSRENEDLRRRLQQIVELNRRIKQYEERMRLASNENQRLNAALRERVDALNRSEVSVKNLTQELEVLRRNKIQIESSFSQRMELDKLQTSRKFTTYEQSLSSVQREYEDLRRRMLDMGNDSSRKIAEYENKIVLMSQEIDRLNQTFKIKVAEYETFVQNLRTELEVSRRETRELQINITQKYEIETSRKISNYEQNLTVLNRELEQLRKRALQADALTRKKNEQIREIENRYRVTVQQFEAYKFQVKGFQGEVSRTHSSYEQNLVKVTRDYEEARRRLTEYENRLALVSQENERLNAIIRNNQNQIQNLRKNLNDTRIQITQKYELETSRKISNYEQTLANASRERDEARRKILEYETLVSNYARELEDKARHLLEVENRHRQLQVTVTNKYQVETTRRFSTYEQTIQTYTRQIQSFKQRVQQYQGLRLNYEKEISRLNLVLKSSMEEHERLKMRMHEVQSSLTHKYESQTSRQTIMYEQSVATMSSQLEEYRRALFAHENASKGQGLELEQLRRKLKEYGQIHRTVTEYELQFAMLKQQLERVNGNLRVKVEDCSRFEGAVRQLTQENDQLRRKAKESQITIINKYQLEVSQKSSLYEQNIGALKRQNEELRRRVAQSEGKIVLMTQQIQRLNMVLKQKVEQMGASELRCRNLQQEVQSCRRKVMQVQKSSTQRHEVEITHTVSVYEQKFTTITRQYQVYKAEATRRLADHETRISLLSQELERENHNLRVRVEEVQRLQRAIRELEVAASKRIDSEKMTLISTYEQNMTAVSRQYEEYKVEASRKLSEYERRLQQLTIELDTLRRQNKQTEVSYSQKFDLEISRKVTTYEQTLSSMRGQLDDYDRKIKQCSRRIAEDENRIAIQTQQIQRLNQALKGKGEESKHYHSEVQKYAAELENLKTNLSGYYSTEIEKLNGIIRQKNEEVQVWQQKFSIAQAGSDSDLKQLQSSYSLMSKEYENSKKHLVEYEQSIRKLYSEFERLQIIINELKSERQTLFDKNHGLVKEIERLTAENRDQESQIYELRLKLADDTALQKRISEHLALMVVLFAEIETLRQRVKDKEKEVQEVRRSSLAPLKA